MCHVDRIDTLRNHHYEHNVIIIIIAIISTITVVSIMMTKVRLMLWDTAGQEEFDALTKSYYRGAQVMIIVIDKKKTLLNCHSSSTDQTPLCFQACVFAFSTTDRASLLAVRKWRKKVRRGRYLC